MAVIAITTPLWMMYTVGFSIRKRVSFSFKILNCLLNGSNKQRK